MNIKLRKSNFLKLTLGLVATSLLWANMVVLAEVSEPTIFGEYAVSIDANTGTILYDKNAEELAFPASITKVMTALLLVENTNENDVITMSEYCTGLTRSGSQAFHTAGEKMDRNTALFSILVTSANDVSCAIGEHISGSETAFGELMSKKANDIGAKNSTFFTASGLHHPGHKTTAYDMGLITREAIKHEIILEAMGTKTIEEKTSMQTKVITNPSKILSNETAIGGKTGFTNAARNTLITINETDGKRVINVVMRSNLNNIYKDIKSISTFGLNQLEKEMIVDKTKWSKTLTFLGKQVIVGTEKNAYMTKVSGEEIQFDLRFNQTKKLDDSYLYLNGIKKGEKIGELEIVKDNEIVSKVDVLSKEAIYFEKKKVTVIPFWMKLMVALLTPVFGYIGLIVLYNRKKNNKTKKPV